MKNSYFKLIAKKRMMNNYFKCFVISFFPIMTMVLLLVLNYFLVELLKSINFNTYLMPYAMYIRVFILVTSLVLSFFALNCMNFFVDCYFLMKALNKKVTFFQTIKCISLRQCLTFFITSIVRFFLSISWIMVYLSPCMAVSGLLQYSYRDNSPNVNLTLFVSSVLLLTIGVFFLYITLKRYSMCSTVILVDEEKNPLKVIVKSIEIMEDHSSSYALYCLSFSGWLLLCLTIIPVIYVVPYIKMSKACFCNSLGLSRHIKKEKEKPIVFYFQKRVEN